MAHELMCKPLGGDDPEAQQVLDEVVNKNYTKAAGMLAPMLITGLGLARCLTDKTTKLEGHLGQ